MLLDWLFIAKIGLVSSGFLLRCSLMRCGSTVIYLPFMNFKSIINQVSHSCVWYFSIVFLAAHTCIKVLNIWIYGYFHCLTVCFIWSSVFGQFFVKLMFFYCLSCFALVPWSSKSSEVKLFSLFVAKKLCLNRFGVFAKTCSTKCQSCSTRVHWSSKQFELKIISLFVCASHCEDVLAVFDARWRLIDDFFLLFSLLPTHIKVLNIWIYGYFHCLIAVLIAIKLFVLVDPVCLMSSDFGKKRLLYYCDT